MNTETSVIRRFKLGTETEAITVYVVVILNNFNTPVELLMYAATMGSTEHGLLSALAATATLALQQGTSMQKIANGWRNTNFAPSGFTNDTQFKSATSIVDYIAQWLLTRFENEKGKVINQ